MNRLVMLGGAVVLLLAIVSTQARPQNAPLAEYPTQSSSVPAAPADTTSPVSSTIAPEESKVSKFFGDVSEAFKQGSAKVKESFESAATSVKDGVMRGYDYVKDKFSGSSATTTPGSPLASSPATTSSDPHTRSVDAKVESAKSLDSNAAAPTASSSAAPSSPTTTKGSTRTVRIEPNDEEPADDDRLIFIGDEDTATDLTPNTSPKPTGSTNEKTNLDDRFILDGPLACPKDQTAVNGKCRNTF